MSKKIEKYPELKTCIFCEIPQDDFIIEDNEAVILAHLCGGHVWIESYTREQDVEEYISSCETSRNILNNAYSSIVPSQMSNRELQHMACELLTAINWKLPEIKVDVITGKDNQGNPTYSEYRVLTDRLKDYQAPFKTE